MPLQEAILMIEQPQQDRQRAVIEQKLRILHRLEIQVECQVIPLLEEPIHRVQELQPVEQLLKLHGLIPHLQDHQVVAQEGIIAEVAIADQVIHHQEVVVQDLQADHLQVVRLQAVVEELHQDNHSG